MTEKLVNLNADVGESFGRYTLGEDDTLIPQVNSIHVACGYHAADPAVMRRSVIMARQHQVELGAHISYPDLIGFGRRTMGLTEDEVCDISIYQIGALLGFCRAEGVRLNHVKPHGQLYLTGVRDPATARGIVRALKELDPELILLMYGDIVAKACADAGIRLVQEGFVDLDYNADSSLKLEIKRGFREPTHLSKVALSLVQRQGREAGDGTWLHLPVRSICIHGDNPNPTQNAKAVRKALTDDGYRLVGLRELADLLPL